MRISLSKLAALAVEAGVEVMFVTDCPISRPPSGLGGVDLSLEDPEAWPLELLLAVVRHPGTSFELNGSRSVSYASICWQRALLYKLFSSVEEV
jgi:hypothetical protein